MQIFVCPRCRRRTEELEVLGNCEHCGQSALAASGIGVDATPFLHAAGHHPTSCVLCGSAGALRAFYLRTYSSTTSSDLFRDVILHKWRDFRSACCEGCYRRVAWLQTSRRVLVVLLYALLFPALILLVVQLKYRAAFPTGIAVAAGAVALVLIMGRLAVWAFRRQLVNRPHPTSVVQGLIAAHESGTGDTGILVIPLATRSESVLY